MTAAVSPLAPAGFPEIEPIRGVRLATIEAGIRYKGRPDVMLAEIAPGGSLAGVFTRSATRAAPVLWCERALAGLPAGPLDTGAAILVNAGNANAFTGAAGTAATERLAEATAHRLAVPTERVFISSTGVIGEPLEDALIRERLDALATALAPGGFDAAAAAIRTTDTFSKGAETRVNLDGVSVRIAGIAKGSGMIAPDMATMLVYLFTDASVARPLLQDMLAAANARTFNCITVDSDTSTSDTVLLAATGAAEMAPLVQPDDPRSALFSDALEGVMRELAHLVVRDGEGASKFVEIRITGAADDRSAHRIAKAVAESPLVKTALAGEDPNWGRIVMAVGKAGEPADRDRLTIRFGDILVAENGWVSPTYVEAEAAAYMRRAELEIAIDLGLGMGASTVWTCDLTAGYIAINADYRS